MRARALSGVHPGVALTHIFITLLVSISRLHSSCIRRWFGSLAATAGIGGGAIAGIIIAVLLLLLIVALVAFARSRGKWCFAGE